MWATTLRVDAPSGAWYGIANVRHPGVRIEVESFYLTADGLSLDTVSLAGADWAALVDELPTLPGVEDVELLEQGESRGTIRVAARAWNLATAIEASGVSPEVPFPVESGHATWRLLGDKDAARAFHGALQHAGLAVTLLTSKEHEPRTLLTARQQEVRDAAIRHGYYDYPRRITLSALAARLGVAKSTLSQSLMMIESEIMKAVPAAALARA